MNRLGRFLISPWAAAILLLLGYILALTALSYKSATFDETAHITGGYAMWLKNDYRLVPHNGNLYQRWAALPALWRKDHFPTTDQTAWRTSNASDIADQFFYQSGNDVGAILGSSRALMGLIFVALGVLIYRWSLSLFGGAGATVSVLLYALSPTVLGQAALATSDMIAAFFFLASVTVFWRLLHRVSLVNVLWSGLALSGLFLSKFSCFAFLPIGLILLLLRLAQREPLPISWPGAQPARGWIGKLTIFLAVFAVLLGIVMFSIWAAYGFRYSSFANDDAVRNALTSVGWEKVLAPMGVAGDVVQFFRSEQWLPESYLYGIAFTGYMTQAQQSFLNGAHSIYGFPFFFPYAFLVKETIPFLLLLGLAVAALVQRTRTVGTSNRAKWEWFRQHAYATAPLWVLLMIYGALCLRSHLDIGLRHLLPLYPVLFIFAGGVAKWFSTRTRVLSGVVLVLLAWHAVEGARIYPNYLTYFNPISGGPSQGYKHLVDSSLDWGQDLPGLKDWLEKNHLNDGATPVYLLYFGTARPEYYRINAKQLPGFPDRVPTEPISFLQSGVYCISATHWAGVYLRCYGDWTQRYEDAYQAQKRLVPAIMAAQFNPDAMLKLEDRFKPQGVQPLLFNFPRLRVARLCAWLREQDRQPDASIGNSILVFRLSADDLRSALEGPLAGIK